MVNHTIDTKGKNEDAISNLSIGTKAFAVLPSARINREKETLH